jgi:hypothetical protein
MRPTPGIGIISLTPTCLDSGRRGRREANLRRMGTRGIRGTIGGLRRLPPCHFNTETGVAMQGGLAPKARNPPAKFSANPDGELRRFAPNPPYRLLHIQQPDCYISIADT